MYSEAHDFPPCDDTFVREFSARLATGLEIRGEKRAATVPERFREAIERASSDDQDDGDDSTSVNIENRTDYRTLVATLEGLTEPVEPTCGWQNVHCKYKANEDPEFCGKGRRRVVYWTEIDGTRWSIDIDYKFARRREGLSYTGVDWFNEALSPYADYKHYFV